MKKLISLSSVCILFLSACQTHKQSNSTSELLPVAVGELHNTYQFSDDVFGGSGPYLLEDFKAIRDAGIRTVISVDGAMPKVEMAESVGLAYIHIPFGYDAVPNEATAQLVKAFRETEGPFYVHCHHGKHRGPAGIAAMLVSAGVLESSEAVKQMEVVGASKSYTGLYRDVARARILTDTEIAAAPSLVSRAKVSDFTKTMVAIDVNWDNLKLVRGAGWQASEKHPDLDPSHEALMVHEHFQELYRADAAMDYSEIELKELAEFRHLLGDAVVLSNQFETGLREQLPYDVIEHRFQGLKNNCKSCHETYRN